MHFSSLPCVPRAPPIPSAWFDHPNIWRSVQFTKLLILIFCLPPFLLSTQFSNTLTLHILCFIEQYSWIKMNSVLNGRKEGRKENGENINKKLWHVVWMTWSLRLRDLLCACHERNKKNFVLDISTWFQFKYKLHYALFNIYHLLYEVSWPPGEPMRRDECSIKISFKYINGGI